MSTINKIAAAGAMMVFMTGCTLFAYPSGSLYTGTVAPSAINRTENSGAGKTGDKMGEACTTGILGLAAFGDASLDAAKKAGGISDVHSVETRVMSILGFVYTQGCTVAHGK
jgi:hypothetical protein